MLRYESKNEKYELVFIDVNTKISKTKRQNFQSQLSNYVENDKSSDLVEIVNNARNILSPLHEKMLSISFADFSTHYLQSVVYFDGEVTAFSSSIGKEHQRVEVELINNKLKVKTDYIVEDIRDVNELNSMHNIIDSFTKKYIRLKEMKLKKEEKVKKR